MLLSFAAVLLATQAAVGDTVPHAAPPPDAATIASAYLDSGARETVRIARDRRQTVDRSIQEYRTLGKQRLSLVARAAGRDRPFLLSETAARIHWRRDGVSRVELLGAREAFPIVSARVRVPSGLHNEGVGLAFDPSDPDLLIARMTDNFSSIRHPLANGSEAHYRFRSGDTTVIHLADRTRVRLVELQVIPRRNEFSLASGSLWLDADTHALVRAVVRPARPWDIELDHDEDDDDVPAFVKPIRAEIRYITIEHGLWERQYWLPRLIAFEGAAQAGRIGGFGGTVRYEVAYSDYRVTGSEVTPPTGELALGDGGALNRCPPRTRGERSPYTCRCENGRCRLYEVIVPADTASLLDTPHLPPTIFTEGHVLITESELREVRELLRKLEPPVWQLERPTVDWGVAGLTRPDLLRYNRVEGLSVGASADVSFGPLAADATVRLGIADLEPNLELGVVRETLDRRLRLAGYRRLETVGFDARALGLGNSLSALLLGRDDGEYFRTLGVEVIGTPPATQPQRYQLRLFGERQTAAVQETDFSVPHLLGRSTGFRPNIEADRANQLGAGIILRTTRGLDPAGLRWGAELGVEGSTGTFDFARPSLMLHAAAPITRGLRGAVEVAGGTSFGDVPVQSLWYLGGTTTVRGFRGGAARGDAFWRARGEVANPLPGARLVLFSDAGWAGARDQVTLDPALLSAGIGASFFDGLVRIDLARALRGETGWRLDAYFGTGL